MKVLKIEHLKKSYKGLCVIDDLNLHVRKHEIVAIVGPSGCGKSTLLNLIAGITSGYEGVIENQAAKTGYVFQEDRVLPWLTVYNNIKIVKDKEDKKRIQELISKMKLNGFEAYYPGQLSGGMRQRCGIARAFYYGSELLLMDEPFKSLDYSLRMEMLSHLMALCKSENTTVVFVTHDIEEALMIADRVLILKGSPAVLMDEMIVPGEKGLRDMTQQSLVEMKEKLVKMIA